jgi:asparagine synthase (glutamine-hydrolysing)
MCGIAGIAGHHDENLVQTMIDTLVHRGPDDEGIYGARGVTLGHRRLSVIDLDTGQQPMSYGDGAFWIVFNGEIYNFRALRMALEAKGHTFCTHSDTEVILAAYAEYGVDCVTHLQGMFAFALWDKGERRLLLARDPMGVKPLYYAERAGMLYFASEMKALLTCPEIHREIDLESLDDYLTYLYTVPPRTIFKEIHQLPPAHSATWHDGEWSLRRYWQLRFEEKERSDAAWVEAIDGALRETVDQQMVADVPLGAFLSGGLDSSTIVHHMAQLDTTPQTFTVGFGEEGRLYDESEEARALAAHFGADHHALEVKADVAELLPAIVSHFDEPFGNPTALLTYSLCRSVRDYVKVVLSGDGGDESFGGYPRYAGVALSEQYRKIPASLRRGLINPLVQMLPESTRGFHGLRRLRQFSSGTLLDPVDMYASWQSYFTPEQKQEVYGGDLRRLLAGRDALDHIRQLARESETDDPVSRAMYIDLHSFLPNNVLHYGDRMSMAHGLETRVPLADHKLVELLADAPSALKIRQGESKILLRRCMRGKLPEADVRRKKQGFNPPMGVWLNTALREITEEYLSESTLRQRGYFEVAPVRAMLQEHRAGRRDYTWHLWSLVLFEQWHRMYLDLVP